MLIIPFLILLLFFGLLITIALKVKSNLAERLSISYLLGIGIFTFLLFAFDLLFNVDYSLNNTFSLLVTLCAILFAILYKDTINFFKTIKFKKEKPKLSKVIFWSFILLIFSYTLVVNIFWPVFDWDALALYDFRARVFMIDKNLIHSATSNEYFLGYPLLTSLSHMFFYQMGLESPKIIYSLFYLSFIVIFYSLLKKRTGDQKAMFFTVVLSLIPEIFSHATVAYTNLPYTIYLCTGTFYLYKWVIDKDKSDLILSAVLVGLSTWVRSSEPFWLVPFIVVFVFSINKKRAFQAFLYLLFSLIISLAWKYFMSFVSDLPAPVSSQERFFYYNTILNISIPRLWMVTTYLYKYVFSTWGLMFGLLILITVRNVFYRKNKKDVPLYTTILFVLLLFAGTLFFSVSFNEWNQIPDSARRMSMFLLPLMLYSIALSTNNEKRPQT